MACKEGQFDVVEQIVSNQFKYDSFWRFGTVINYLIVAYSFRIEWRPIMLTKAKSELAVNWKGFVSFQ